MSAAPVKSGGSVAVVKLPWSGEAARSAFNVTGVSGLGGGGEVSNPEVDAASVASTATISPTDWRLLARCCSSSSSSAISPSLRRRIELVEEDVDPEAACREHAEASFESLSSAAVAMEKVVSWGENRSHTELK